jgi:type I restriction enzyme, S subunit
MRWEIKSIGELCEIFDNKRKPITKRNRKEGEIPYYGATGVLSYVDDFIFNEKLVLLGEDGAKWESGDNSSFIINGKTWVNNHAHVLKPKRNFLLDEWLVYNLNHQNLMPYVNGMTVPKLNQGNMKKIKIPVPPLSEQKQIVETLDKAFEKIDKAIANIERNIQNAEELFQSKLNNFFLEESDYKEVKIIETCDDKSQIVGGPFGSNLKVKDYVDIGVPILRLQNIGKGYFINKSIKYITQNKAEELKYHSFKKGDIVLAKLGIPIGKTCIVPESFEYGIVVADVVRIRPNINLVNYSFLKNFLNSDSAVSQLSSEIRGSTRPRVNISEVRNLKLRLPPIDIQIEINHKIEKLNDLRTEQVNNYNIKLGSLLELKKSILDKAFKGELTSAA